MLEQPFDFGIQMQAYNYDLPSSPQLQATALEFSPTSGQICCGHGYPNNLKLKFTEEEDQRLLYLVRLYGNKDWIIISRYMQTRNPRQCRERYKNYLNPNLRKDAWSPEEDRLLNQKYAELGAKWNKISKFFKNRSDNNIRNRWMLIARRKAKLVTQRSSMRGHAQPFLMPSPPIMPIPQQQVVVPSCQVNYGVEFNSQIKLANQITDEARFSDIATKEGNEEILNDERQCNAEQCTETENEIEVDIDIGSDLEVFEDVIFFNEEQVEVDQDPWDFDQI